MEAANMTTPQERLLEDDSIVLVNVPFWTKTIKNMTFPVNKAII